MPNKIDLFAIRCRAMSNNSNKIIKKEYILSLDIDNGDFVLAGGDKEQLRFVDLYSIEIFANSLKDAAKELLSTIEDLSFKLNKMNGFKKFIEDLNPNKLNNDGRINKY